MSWVVPFLLSWFCSQRVLGDWFDFGLLTTTEELLKSCDERGLLRGGSLETSCNWIVESTPQALGETRDRSACDKGALVFERVVPDNRSI